MLILFSIYSVLEGLNNDIQMILDAHSLKSFQQMVDKAVVVESKCHVIEDKKRKCNSAK